MFCNVAREKCRPHSRAGIDAAAEPTPHAEAHAVGYRTFARIRGLIRDGLALAPRQPETRDPKPGNRVHRNIYRDLKFPDNVYQHIAQYYEEKAEAATSES